MFQLAENLHMTVTRMMSEMTMGEYVGWLRFYGQRDKQTTPDGKPNLLAGDGSSLVQGLGI